MISGGEKILQTLPSTKSKEREDLFLIHGLCIMATSSVHTLKHYSNILLDEDHAFRIKDMMTQANKQKIQYCFLYLEVATSVTGSRGL